MKLIKIFGFGRCNDCKSIKKIVEDNKCKDCLLLFLSMENSRETIYNELTKNNKEE